MRAGSGTLMQINIDFISPDGTAASLFLPHVTADTNCAQSVCEVLLSEFTESMDSRVPPVTDPVTVDGSGHRSQQFLTHRD